MNDGRHYDEQQIRLIVNNSIGKTVADFMSKEVLSFESEDNKGGLGQLVEKYIFNMNNNSESEADFVDAGIELKVTPYKKLKNNQLSAKERLVLNIIDYNTEYANSFKTSHFWNKNKKLQILWYLWTENGDKFTYKITHEKLLDLSLSEDLKQIEKDWEYIINKIKEGKADELSEGDTMYLGACTKGANANSLRSQPFSDKKAMQRAFCFKNSYMTQLVRKYIGDYTNVESILKNTDMLFDDYVKIITNKYVGKTFVELKNIFGIKDGSKDVYNRVINRMFNVKKGLKNTDEFVKANIIPKTIRVEKNGIIREDISFPVFKFMDIIKETWEDSRLKEELETTKYMFFIFKNNGSDYVFEGYKLFNMPESIIENSIKPFWEETVSKIKNGIKFTITGNVVSNDLPCKTHNGYMHVRPHASQAAYKLNNGFTKGNIKKDGDLLPSGEYMTKQCFWFNREYIKSVVCDN